MSAVVTLAVFLFLRFVHMTPHGKCGAGMWVLVLNAALITVFDLYNLSLVEASDRPAVVDGDPDPGVGDDHADHATADADRFAHGRGDGTDRDGHRVPAAAGRCSSPGVTFVLYLPNFIWAVIATLPAAMFQRWAARFAKRASLAAMS